MRRALRTIFDDNGKHLSSKISSLYTILIAANIAVWVSTITTFHEHPVLIGTALLSYGFGLRHAVDADHIAAIDNVTRKLMQDGKQPTAVGFFFSLGHSTIVLLASTAIAVADMAFKDQIEKVHAMGGVIGTSISSLFLLIIAIMNISITATVYRTFRHVKAGGRFAEEDLDMQLSGGGVLRRVMRPMFGLIRDSWHMYPIGVLFGLGFDTATEVGLLGISAAQASQGLPLWSILLFPALFTAGMSLIDTTDSILMVGAYGWAFVKPIRKLYYNLTITLVSVVVALLVGGIEALGLVGEKLGLHGPFWDAIGALNDNFGLIGYIIIGIFIVSWVVALLIYRWRGYDNIEVSA
jgi:nickel/cobalt transporter (NiCoT) family protein